MDPTESGEKALINVKKAVRKSIEYLRDLQALAGGRIEALRVVEVKRGNEDCWEITLSYLWPPDGIEEGVDESLRLRSFEAFQLKTNTGAVESMLARDVHVA